MEKITTKHTIKVEVEFEVDPELTMGEFQNYIERIEIKPVFPDATDMIRVTGTKYIYR